MMAGKATFLCPYCYDTSNLSDVEYYCPSCKTYKIIPITIMSRASNLASQRCPDCNQTMAAAVCPQCHRKIPEGTLTGKNTIISIVGTRGSGKSHYVGVLMDELCHRVAPEFNASFVDFGGSQAEWKRKFGKLYDDVAPQALEATAPGSQEAPLIYEMKVQRGPLLKLYTFAFFDTAGENFGDEDLMAVINKYIYMSSGIICLLDPFQIPDIEERIAQREPAVFAGSSSGAAKTSNISVMSHVSNLIRNYRGMRSTSKIKTPIALVLTKLDAIASLIQEDSTVLNGSASLGNIDLNDMHNVDAEIRAFLLRWGEEAFITTVKNDYTNYSFFAVSALGLENHPDADNDRKIKRPLPHRVEDPFLWILRENGILGDSRQPNWLQNLKSLPKRWREMIHAR